MSAQAGHLLARGKGGDVNVGSEPIVGCPRTVEESERLVSNTMTTVTHLLDAIEQRPPDGAHLLAFDVLLESAMLIRQALCQAAGPDRLRRGHVLVLLAAVLSEFHSIAPVAAHGLVDPDPSVRLGAARLIKALTDAPAIAKTARRSAAAHPDEAVRKVLGAGGA